MGASKMISTSRAMTTAMICAAAVTAEFVGGAPPATPLLTSLHVAALPAMLIATSMCSILLVAAHARWGGAVTPALLVPASFVASGVLFLCEWPFRSRAPSATAAVAYLHISGAGPILASGFWLIASERFDPRTAKRHFGRIGAAGTLGTAGAPDLRARGVAVGVPSMLLLGNLPVFHGVARSNSP